MRSLISSAKLAALFAACLIAGSAQAGTFSLYGDAFIDSGTPAIDLTSTSGTYSGIRYIPDAGTKLSDITQLSVDYNMVSGAFGGGAPRLGIRDASTLNQIWVYWGTLPGLTNPNANDVWANTGNFADAATGVRNYSNGFGGYTSPYPGVDWNALLALVGNVEIDRIYLDLDGGFTGNQHMLVNNFTINGDVFAIAETPLPAALPLFASGLGVLGFAAYRRRRTARAS